MSNPRQTFTDNAADYIAAKAMEAPQLFRLPRAEWDIACRQIREIARYAIAHEFSIADRYGRDVGGVQS